MAKRLSALLAATVLAGAVFVAGQPDRAIATFPGANGRIAYVGPNGIYVTGSKGHGEARRLTGKHRTTPAWSPDGRRIAYELFRDDGADIYKMKASGKRKVLLTRGDGSGYDPSWSPSGKKVAFVRIAPPGNAIFKMRANGAGKRRVTPKDGPDAYFPAWSPDGNRIAFVCDFVHHGSQICSIRPDGTHRRVLTDTPGKAKSAPDWSPDGRRIAFAAGHRNHRDIYVMDADGSSVRRITPRRGHDETLPSWSPDGTRIAFVRIGGGIWKMHADGSHRKSIITAGTFPAWQPK